MLTLLKSGNFPKKWGYGTRPLSHFSVCVVGDMHMPWHACGGQRAIWGSKFSPSTVWVLEIKLNLKTVWQHVSLPPEPFCQPYLDFWLRGKKNLRACLLVPPCCIPVAHREGWSLPFPWGCIIARRSHSCICVPSSVCEICQATFLLLSKNLVKITQNR